MLRKFFGMYLSISAYFGVVIGIGLLLSGVVALLSPETSNPGFAGLELLVLGTVFLSVSLFLRKWGHKLRFDG